MQKTLLLKSMASQVFFKTLVFFFRFLLKRLRNPRPLYRKGSSNAHHHHHHHHHHHPPTSRIQRYPSQIRSRSSLLSGFSNHTLLLDVEGALLKSSSTFPYFMCVAFEAGGFLRALLLLILYPLICCVGKETALEVMVMACFFGIREKEFRVGRAVLPKFFLEDVGLEGFEMLGRAGRTVAVSELPKVLVEGFLREYLEVEDVVGRELKVVCGFYVGLMEGKKKVGLALEEIMLGDGKMGTGTGDVVGIGSFKKCLDQHFVMQCKEIYLVTEGDKRNYHPLPRDRYPRPLIFHDGRLAFRPTPLSTLSMFIWFPFGFLLAIFRALVALFLPHKLSVPILSLTGLKLRFKRPANIINPDLINSNPDHKLLEHDPKGPKGPKGTLYVCNHRTLLDPLYVSAALNKPLTAVTYSLSRISEILAPIKTVRLTRDREKDRKRMEKLLNQGDLVVCPEGTTCREPFLLRFSPLFAELSDDIVPVALDAHVSMFYGTTASGLKCLDPLFFLMNPFPCYHVQLLEKVAKEESIFCGGGIGGKSRIEVANLVQGQMSRALGFECTQLTRKDKYLILAGNEGIVNPTVSKLPKRNL